MWAPGVVINYIPVNLVVGVLVAVGLGAAFLGIWLSRKCNGPRR